MSTFIPFELYDLVPCAGGPPCSSSATRTRLALLHKGLPFKVIELTYKQLRTGPYCETVGAGADGVVTVPFIKRPDGTYLRDSMTIIRWLDEAYPDKPSPFMPTADLPIDDESEEYANALNDYSAFRKELVADPTALSAMKTLEYVPLSTLLDRSGENNVRHGSYSM